MNKAVWLIMFDEKDQPNVVWDRVTFTWRKASELELKEARANDPRYFRLYPQDIYAMKIHLNLYKEDLKTPEQRREESLDDYFDEEYR